MEQHPNREFVDVGDEADPFQIELTSRKTLTADNDRCDWVYFGTVSGPWL